MKTINENEAKLDISGQIVKFLLKIVLVGAVGIIVRLRSGGQLAMTLVASISIFIPPSLFCFFLHCLVFSWKVTKIFFGKS